jgi:flavodoxin
VARGFKVVGSFSCKGFDGYGFVKHLGGVNKGRPDEEDIHKAEAFAESLKTAY